MLTPLTDRKKKIVRMKETLSYRTKKVLEMTEKEV